MIKLLKKLATIPSTSGDEDEIISFIERFYEGKDVLLKRVGNNLIVEYEAKGDTKVFNAHVDTVKPSGTWKTNPFEAKETKEKIFGVGTSDMKCTIAILMSMHDFFKESNQHVIVTFVEKEETTGEGSRKVCKHLKKMKLQNPVCIIGESTNASWFEIGNKGNIFFEKTYEGKSSHSSKPKQGINSIHKAIDEAKKINKNLKALHKTHDLLGKSTHAYPTMIKGGTSVNTIPQKTVVKGDVRTTPKNHEEAVKYLESQGFTIFSNVQPYVCKDKTLHEFINKQNLPKKPSTGSNDAVFFANTNIPTIIFGAGTKKCIHKPNEYVKKQNMKQTKQLYKTFTKL